MGKTIDLLLSTLEEIFEKGEWGAHAPLLASVRDLTPVQAAWSPAPERKSIWQNVNHVTFWKTYLLSRMAGEPARPSGWYRDLDWREITEVTDENWRGAIDRLVEAEATVLAELGRRQDADLEELIVGTKVPIYHWVQRIIAHDCYHCGQIMYLRALQGLPPIE
ncbi:MAG TPA: DinB family protein [bacterium]|jgi:uncharacterized damage-inducible protein DinB|nr:DinB family protein [bacterium]